MANFWENAQEMPDQLVGEVTNNNNINNYNALLDKATTKWELDPSQLEDYINKIAFHESGGVVDKLQGNKGPCRGMFQFEKTYLYPEGHELAGQYGQAGGLTARNRTADWFKSQNMEVPAWLTQEGMHDPSVGFDASTLNPEQQKMLFLANYLQKPGESSGMYGITDENLPEWWAREHWAGAEEDKPERLASFEGNMNVYGV